MPEYRVTWEIDIHADSPEEAARVAQAFQRDPEGRWMCGVFDVLDEHGETTRIDLDELDQEPEPETTNVE